MIEALARPAPASDLDELARLLVDAVESGASVSFMSPFSVSEAREWWRTTLAQANALYPDGRPCDTVVFYKKL